MSLRLKRMLWLLALGLSVGWSLAIWHDFTMLPPGHVYEIIALNALMYIGVFLYRHLNGYGTRGDQWWRIGWTFITAFTLMRWAAEYWAYFSTLQMSN